MKKKDNSENKVAKGHGAVHSNGSRLGAVPCLEAIKGDGS